MRKKRIPVEPELAGRVLFASDRTCCVCRQPGRKVEIHHIDGNPANNAFSNLAVVCKDCQSDAHTNHAFARNLTPETVVLYNASWRSIVASRLSPGSSIEALGHRGAALGDLASTLGKFETKLRWLAHANGHEWFTNAKSPLGEGYEEELDVDYSPDNWERYRRLFEQDIPDLVDRLERLILLYADVVQVSLKAEVMTLSRVMPSECGQFLQLPNLRPGGALKPADVQSLFRVRFVGLMGMVKRAKRTFENAYEVATTEFEAATASRQKSTGE